MAGKNQKDETGGDWIKQSVLYSMMVRTSGAWDHDRSFSLDLNNFNNLKETGTFVKTLALLPLLKKMGVDVVYMLPLSRFSLKNKKGELGSPYAVASFFDLDPNLKDPMTGTQMSLKEEFQAFIEACHILDMKIVIDIIPRTNAVENELIANHPEWFYWIDADTIDDYRVPRVKGLPDTLSPEKKYMDAVYASDDVKRHIRMFRHNPKKQNPALWEKIKTNHPDGLTEAIKNHFNLRVAPAFSDHINDIQPPWTDVTFFRMYMDHPKDTRKYLDDPKSTPPYILFDTIKANLFTGDEPNEELWGMLSDIIPYYQKTYGIDGARIDMGHALPRELLKKIMDKARAVDSEFAFIAEELNPDNSADAKSKGYNIMIGNGFWMEPRIFEKKLHKFVYGAKNLAIPEFACAETHDSMRIAGREGGETLARMIAVFNMLMPNLVPFINSGQEVYETQPMNTGVDCTEDDRFNLPEDDMFYGKLALFDKYAFHYLHPRRWEIPDHLTGVKKIRSRWIDAITDPGRVLPLYFDTFDTPAIGFAYVDKANKKGLIVVANSNVFDTIDCNADIAELRQAIDFKNHEGKLMYATYEMGHPYTRFSEDGRIHFHLGAGEVKVIEVSS